MNKNITRYLESGYCFSQKAICNFQRKSLNFEAFGCMGLKPISVSSPPPSPRSPVEMTIPKIAASAFTVSRSLEFIGMPVEKSILSPFRNQGQDPAQLAKI